MAPGLRQLARPEQPPRLAARATQRHEVAFGEQRRARSGRPGTAPAPRPAEHSHVEACGAGTARPITPAHDAERGAVDVTTQQQVGSRGAPPSTIAHEAIRLRDAPRREDQGEREVGGRLGEDAACG
jgi:hypothetical protein